MKKEVVIAAVALIFLIGCAKTETITVDQALKNIDLYRGKEVFLVAKVTQGDIECKAKCREECCDDCTARIYVQDSIKIPTNLFCSSNGCETSCPVVMNETATLSGRLEINQLGHLSFNSN